MPARLGVALPAALAGAALGLLRVGDITARQWLVVACAYALRPRLLVTGCAE